MGGGALVGLVGAPRAVRWRPRCHLGGRGGRQTALRKGIYLVPLMGRGSTHEKMSGVGSGGGILAGVFTRMYLEAPEPAFVVGGMRSDAIVRYYGSEQA